MRLTITKYKLTKPKTIFNLFGTNITPVFLLSITHYFVPISQQPKGTRKLKKKKNPKVKPRNKKKV